MRFKISSMRLKLWSNHTRSNLNSFKLTPNPPQPKKNHKLNKNRKQSKIRKKKLNRKFLIIKKKKLWTLNKR